MGQGTPLGSLCDLGGFLHDQGDIIPNHWCRFVELVNSELKFDPMSTIGIGYAGKHHAGNGVIPSVSIHN